MIEQPSLALVEQRLVRREYIGGIIGLFAAQLEGMTTGEKVHSAGILADTFLTHNVTHGLDAYAVELDALTPSEQETTRVLLEAAEWGDSLLGSAERRISSRLRYAFEQQGQDQHEAYAMDAEGYTVQDI